MGAFFDLHAFWQMGGYAGTVWSAYGIVLVALVGQLIIAGQKLRRLRKSLQQKYAQSS